uniref:Hypothetical secreted ESEH peptide n=1 Tax=Simulium nigrimanum TaxID=683695 RepID=D1FQ35_SIMNI
MKLILLALIIGLAMVDLTNGSPDTPPNNGQNPAGTDKTIAEVTGIKAESEHVVPPPHLTNIYK